MWGLAGWTGSDRKETDDSLNLAVESGVNFFDTAWGYGEGLSERILGDLIRRYPGVVAHAAREADIERGIPIFEETSPVRTLFHIHLPLPGDV